MFGGAEMFLFNGVGGRVPDGIARPFVDGVWPLWRGDPLPGWAFGRRFARNLLSLAFPNLDRRPAAATGWLMFAPLLLFQALAFIAMCRVVPRGAPADPGTPGSAGAEDRP